MSTAVSIRAKLAPGTAITRAVLALVKNGFSARAAADDTRRLADTPQVAVFLDLLAPRLFDDVDLEHKAAVAAGSTVDGNWAAALARSGIADDFMAIVYARSVFGQLRERAISVPFLTTVPMATAAPATYWVGQGTAKPASSFTVTNVALEVRKAVAWVTISNELARLMATAGVALTRQTLVDACIAALDGGLLDAVAGDSDRPASILNGVLAATSTGSTSAALAADLSALVDSITTSGSGLVFIARPALAAKVALLTQSDGKLLAGIPLLKSPHAPSGTIVLLDSAELLLAGGATDSIVLDGSTQASVQLSDTPSDGAANAVSLWQNDLSAVRCEIFVNWSLRSAGAVAALGSIA